MYVHSLNTYDSFVCGEELSSYLRLRIESSDQSNLIWHLKKIQETPSKYVLLQKSKSIHCKF